MVTYLDNLPSDLIDPTGAGTARVAAGAARARVGSGRTPGFSIRDGEDGQQLLNGPTAAVRAFDDRVAEDELLEPTSAVAAAIFVERHRAYFPRSANQLTTTVVGVSASRASGARIRNR